MKRGEGPRPFGEILDLSISFDAFPEISWTCDAIEELLEAASTVRAQASGDVTHGRTAA
jgi:hypothetical protein